MKKMVSLLIGIICLLSFADEIVLDENQREAKTNSAVGCEDSYEPNDEITNPNETAFNNDLGTSVLSESISGTVHESGDWDHYGINITSLGTLTLNLTSIPDGFDLQLYDYNHKYVTGSFENGDEKIVQSINETGEYYIIVGSLPGDHSCTSYYLKVDWLPDPVDCEDSYEPNDNISNPNTDAFPDDLSSSEYNKTIDATIHETDDWDHYLLNVTNKGELKITLTKIPDSYDLQLYDQDHNYLAGSITAGDEEIDYSVTNPGEYYIIVGSLESDYSCNQYSLTIAWTPELTNIFTDDRDGHIYKYVTIGNQVWMAENLSYLPEVSPPDIGSSLKPFYYVYGYQGSNTISAKAAANYQTYGVLYNWSAAMAGQSSSSANPSGVQGVCPSGWHIPSDAEWKQLEMYLGMSQSEADRTGYRGTDEGNKLKAESGWEGTGNGSNSSGFTSLPGGSRNANGTFNDLGYYDNYWNSTEKDNTLSGLRSMGWDYSEVRRLDYYKENGFSVRCVKGSGTTNCIDAFEPNNEISDPNTLAFNSNLSSISYTKSINGTIHEKGDWDHYRVNTTIDGTLTLKLTDVPEGFDLQLYDFNHNYITGSFTTGDEEIIQPISTAGEYYIIVGSLQGAYSCTPYKLEITWVADISGCEDVYESNDAITNASNTAFDANLGSFEYNKSINGTIHEPGDWDHYRINILNSGTLELALAANPDGYIMQLYDYNHTYIAGSLNEGDNDISQIIKNSGVYYIIIGSMSGKNSCTSYTLELNWTPELIQTFTDNRDGHVYRYVNIGKQYWMAENLAFLPEVNPSASGSETEPYYYVYGFQGSSVVSAKNNSNYTQYGVLYNWPAAMNNCPSGWYLPGDNEWLELETFLGMSSTQANAAGMRGTDEGNKLKTTSGWASNGNGTDNYRFGAKPGGVRNHDGIFETVGTDGYWWTSTPSGNLAYRRIIRSDDGGIDRGDYYKDIGRSVRCVRGSVTTCPDIYEPNETVTNSNNSAFSESLLDSAFTRTIPGTIHKDGDWDYFRLDVQHKGIINISLKNITEGIDLQLYDQDLNYIAGSLTQGNEVIRKTIITKGFYYIVIGSFSGDYSCTPFSLETNWTPTDTLINISPLTRLVDADQGTAIFQVKSDVEWQAFENSSWISIANADKSNLTIKYDENTDTESRTATIIVTGTGAEPQTITICQDSYSCSVRIAPQTIAVRATSGISLFKVTSSCNWTASENADWLSVTKLNNESFSVVYDENTGSEKRAANIMIYIPDFSSHVVSVEQIGILPALNVMPESRIISPSPGTITFNVTSNIDWIVSENSPWLSVTKNSPTLLTVTYNENNSEEERNTELIITGPGVASRILTIKQEGITDILNVSPLSKLLSAESGTTIFSVTSNHAWTVYEQSEWLNAKKLDAGKLMITFTKNTGTDERGATITITGKENDHVSITMKQSGMGETLIANPMAQTVNSEAGVISFTVSPDIYWLLAEYSDWLEASMTNDTTLTVVYKENSTDNTRTAEIKVSGFGKSMQTVNITQLSENPGTLINISERKSVKIFPNPGSDKIYLSSDNDHVSDLTISVYNSSGQLLQSKKLSQLSKNEPIELDISGLKNGVYILQIKCSGYINAYKLIKDQ